MPLPMGNASGVDTEEMINKLVEVEKAPMLHMELRQKELEYESEALKEMRLRTDKLRKALQSLTGFEAGFERKVVLPSAEGYISGIANRNAREATYKIEIPRIAGRLRIRSAAIPENHTIPAGAVTINGKTQEFSGGTPEELRDFLNKYFATEIKAGTVILRPGEKTVFLESLKTGVNSIPTIEDPAGILTSIGLLSPGTAPFVKPEVAGGLASRTIPFEPSLLLPPVAASFKAEKNSLSVSLGSAKTRSLPITTDKETLRSLSVSIRFSEKPPEEDNLPETLSEGPLHHLTIKEFELSTYNITRIREKESDESVAEAGIIWHLADGQTSRIPLPNGPSLQMIPQGATAVEFFASKGTADFSDLTWNVEAPAESGEQLRQSAIDYQTKSFPFIIEHADDALVTIDGVTVERPENTGLTDIIEGATLTLHAKTNNPIDLQIVNSTKEATEQIQLFVESYNDLVAFSREAAKSTEVKEVGKYNEMKQNTGILVTNASVRSLISGLKMKVSGAYPSIREPGYHVLSDIGIHTGMPGTAWKEISEGFLNIHEEKLEEALRAHPESVRNFFGLDSNNDYRLDDGFAVVTIEFLEPYSRGTGGIFTAQIKSNEEKVVSIGKDIKRVEEHAETYRIKLKQRFGYMESSVSKTKATGDALRQRFNQRGD